MLHHLFGAIVVRHGGIKRIFKIALAQLFGFTIGRDDFLADSNRLIHHFGSSKDFVLVFLDGRFQHLHQGSALYQAGSFSPA